MSPTLRSVIAQANRSWRSAAPRRNFSSSPPESNGAGKTAVKKTFIIQGLAMGVGYAIGEVYWHDWVQKKNRSYDESMEYADQSEKKWDYLIAEAGRKPRVALVSDRQLDYVNASATNCG